MAEAAKTDLPPYVVVGEWREAFFKAETNQILTPSQRCLLHDYPRPRSHPYGYDAWQHAFANGKVMIFPSEEAHDAWFAIPRS